MILDCEVCISNNVNNGYEKNVRFTKAKLGIGKDEKSQKNYLVVVQNNKKFHTFRLLQSNVIIHPMAFKIKHPKCMIIIRDASDKMFQMFKKLVEKIIYKKKPIPPLLTINEIIKKKPLPITLNVDHSIEDLKKLNNPTLKKINLENIENINLNDIKKISTMKFLTALSILNCNLEKIPFELSNLKKLNYLNLSNNRIKEVPMWFCNEMRHLKGLILKNNLIELVPFEITILTNCEELDFSSNRIEFFPSSLYHRVYARSNGESHRFSKIDFSNNRINHLPELAFLHNENETCQINLDQNPYCSYKKPPFLSERGKFFKDASLYNLCLAKIVSQPELFEKLLDYKLTPISIYNYLQRILFTCFNCLKPNIEWGANYEKTNYILGNHSMELNFLFTIIICNTCNNQQRSRWNRN